MKLNFISQKPRADRLWNMRFSSGDQQLPGGLNSLEACVTRKEMCLNILIFLNDFPFLDLEFILMRHLCVNVHANHRFISLYRLHIFTIK